MDQSVENKDVGDVVPATGRIDIHSHLLPAVDDGCRVFEESLECIRQLQEAGFIGSICTPHVYGEDPNCNLIQHIRFWVARFQEQLQEAGVVYRVWPGGELRLFEGVIDWLEDQEVPTLAGSRCVLVDFWDLTWPNWVTPVFEWLLDRDYRPILAHPERMACTRQLGEKLNELVTMGVWLQGNSRPMTGCDSVESDRWVRQLLGADCYQFMATDTHRPQSQRDRLDGMQLVAQEYGRSKLDELTIAAPRRFILSSSAG